MNYKFTKKPVEIEAFQMTKGRKSDKSEWPDWLKIAWNKDIGEEGCMFYRYGMKNLFIETLEGDHEIGIDDYIIRGVKGELYPCKPDIFEMTYDE